MYNSIEYKKICGKTTGISWYYHRDEPNSGLGAENNNVNYSIEDSNYLDYKTRITGKLAVIDTTINAESVVPLKYLSNFWRTLDIPYSSCEVSLILTWSKDCVKTSRATRDAVTGVNLVAGINNAANAAFKITTTKLCIPVVTLSTENDNRLLEQLKTGFRRTIK